MKLGTAAKIVCQRAKDKLAKGQIPQFLGLKGMLALMYEHITRYSETAGEDYVLDLAVDALVAFAGTIENWDLTPEAPLEEEIRVDPNAGQPDDPRWTPVRPRIEQEVPIDESP